MGTILTANGGAGAVTGGGGGGGRIALIGQDVTFITIPTAFGGSGGYLGGPGTKINLELQLIIGRYRLPENYR